MTSYRSTISKILSIAFLFALVFMMSSCEKDELNFDPLIEELEKSSSHSQQGGGEDGITDDEDDDEDDDITGDDGGDDITDDEDDDEDDRNKSVLDRVIIKR